MYYDIYVGAGGMAEWLADTCETEEAAVERAKQLGRQYGERRVTIHPRKIAG